MHRFISDGFFAEISIDEAGPFRVDALMKLTWKKQQQISLCTMFSSDFRGRMLGEFASKLSKSEYKLI